MSRARPMPYGVPKWAPKDNVVEGATILGNAEVDGIEYVRTYSKMIADFNYELPETLKY